MPLTALEIAVLIDKSMVHKGSINPAQPINLDHFPEVGNMVQTVAATPLHDANPGGSFIPKLSNQTGIHPATLKPQP